MEPLYNRGYYPLTEHAVRSSVPESSGLYLLAVMTENRQFRNFYATYSENLAESLLERIDGVDDLPTIYDTSLSPCYYFTFVTFSGGNEIEQSVGKLLMNTTDPVSRLKVINCN